MEIASFVIGLIALVAGVMALPTFFQMFFGHPKLRFETDEFTGTDDTVLVLRIINDPVKNRFLRMIGVERETADLVAFIDVQEQGTGKFLERTIPAVLQEIPTQMMGRLARCIPGFSVGVMAFVFRNGSASIVDGRVAPPNLGNVLPEGHYVARIAVMRGQHTYHIVKGFRIGKLKHEAIWYGELAVSKS